MGKVEGGEGVQREEGVEDHGTSSSAARKSS